ncbi:MAG: metallophosphoesterase [Kiloniellales bacterium]|nr:metallophosphoesterase [Kiloniellales bacterium]
MKHSWFCSAIVAVAMVLIAACDFRMQQGVSLAGEVPRPLTVAFIGDQGTGVNARRVLELIRAEGADLVLHQGDLGYGDPPEKWDALITDILGAEFPYFATIGNHDVNHWYGAGGYQEFLQARLDRIEAANCSGDLGVQAACSYRGLFFIQSGIGTLPNEPDHPDHIAFLREKLTRSKAPWKVCSWHKVQRIMHVGRYRDKVGWAAYEACREAGALIATAHWHSYSRTYLMDGFELPSIASATSSTLHIAEGRTFAFVSGLGGESIRDQDRTDPWWAAIYTENQDASYGALFCSFSQDSDHHRASCYFKDINGFVPDRFGLISELQYPDA